ncbi:hypothetical protein [Ethanoligenens sp.]|uniref:hypothetical protein n=1 Tax=Ethanoligenens sp. TaxID=2099655 RepID=UPI0039EC767B
MANKKMQQVQKDVAKQEDLLAMPIKTRINACRPVDADKRQTHNPWEDETFRDKPGDLFGADIPFLHILTEQPMRSNPFSLIHCLKDIDAFVFALARMTAWRTDKCDSYWYVACGHLYHALVGYVYYQGTLEEQNLKTVLELLREIQYEEEGVADLLFQKLAQSVPDDLTVFYYHQYKDAAHIVQKAVWISCVSLLRSFELFPAFDAGAGECYPIPRHTSEDDPHDAKERPLPFVTGDRIVRSAQTAIDLIHRAHCVHPEKMPRTDLEALNVLSNLLTIETTSAIKERFPDEAENIELLVLCVLRNAAERSILMSRKIFSRRDIRVLNPLLRALFPVQF